ncbi:MAG: ATP-binding cassette domain-containing protein, partial [Alphaproteobacteria bacterium]
MKPLLEVEDLRVSFATPTGRFEAVRGVSFSLGRERLGIVGESGSGKSLTGRAIMRLLPAAARMEASKLNFDGIDLLGASARQLRGIRGARISLVLQDPKYSLNPVMTVGEQIAEAARIHGRVSARQARRKALEMLEAV